MHCSSFLICVCKLWMHLEDCFRVSASCEGSHIYVQEIQDRIWTLSGMSYLGLLSKGSMLGMFCTQGNFVQMHEKSWWIYIVQNFQASSSHIRATT